MFAKYLNEVEKGLTIDDIENVFHNFSTLYRRSMRLEEKDSGKGLLLFHCLQKKVKNLETVFEWLFDNKEWRAISSAVSLAILSDDLNTHIEILNQVKKMCGDYLYPDGLCKEEKNAAFKINAEQFIGSYIQVLTTYYAGQSGSKIPSELVGYLPDVVCEKLCKKVMLSNGYMPVYEHPTFLEIVFKTPSKGVTEFLDYITSCRYDSQNDPFAKLLLENQTTINTFLEYDISQFGNRQWNIGKNEFYSLQKMLSSKCTTFNNFEWKKTESVFKEVLKMFPIEQLSASNSQRLFNILPYFSDEALRSLIQKMHLHHEVEKTRCDNQIPTKKVEKRKI